MIDKILDFLYPTRNFTLHMNVIFKYSKTYEVSGVIIAVDRQNQIILIKDENGDPRACPARKVRRAD